MLERLDTLMRASNRLSREAGMAEVAIGVLHNVGNAMTSVSTGVGLACEALEALPTRRTVQLAELLRSHRDDLPEFLGQPGKAETLVEFVGGLARNLEQSRDNVRAELEAVTTAVTHAVAVIAAQQRHARRIDAMETCRLRELVDDAIRISGVERPDGSILVDRDCDDGTVKIDRHRLLEILVNLLKNAGDALRRSERAGGRIRVAAGRTGEGFFVRVHDDGPGVPEHARTKIFAMGYTTKPEGHGFGLHASSNAAIEMSGALRLLPSEEGATFELTIGVSGPATPGGFDPPVRKR
jgi:signal transduction histidine kinase